MIFTTIALIWLAAAAVFVLALGMAAAKQMPQPESPGHAVLNATSQEGHSVEEAHAPTIHLYCGRSMKLPVGRPLPEADENPIGQRAVAGRFQTEDSRQAVSF